MGKPTQAVAGKKRVRVISPEEKAKRAAYAKAYNAGRKEIIAARDRERYAKNGDAMREASKIRQRAVRASRTEAEKEAKRAYFKARYDAKRMELLAQKKAAYEADKGLILARNNAWRDANGKACKDANREDMRTYMRIYRREKWASDPAYKMAERLRNRLYTAIRNKLKTGSAVRDLGCSTEFLVSHIESQFTGDMSWETWGVSFEIDHIFPLAAANLEDRTEFLAANNWRNLQPLAPQENRSKNDTVTPAARRLFDALVAEFSQQAVA